MSHADNTWALAKALDDIIVKGRQSRSVVLYPRSSKVVFHPQDLIPPYWNPEWMAIYEIIQDLIDMDVVVVTCAGDNAQRLGKNARNIPDRAPAVWNSGDFPIIVAGAVTGTGQFSTFSQGKDVSQDIAWAPGDSVVCAGLDVRQYWEARGTGFAAGMVGIESLSSLKI